MAVKIRLKRIGKKRAPYFRIVVMDGRAKRDGRAIEEIGKYNPKAEPSFIHVESDRAQYWLGVGAQPTEAVVAILKASGDWQRFNGEPPGQPLKVAEPKRDKTDIFNEALGLVSDTPAGGAKKKLDKPGKRSDKPAKKSDRQPEDRPAAKNADKTADKTADKSERPEGRAAESPNPMP